MRKVFASALSLAAMAALGVSSASGFSFSTGAPDGLMATASQPASSGKIEIESADDFVLPSQTKLTSATFTGLLTDGSTPADVGNVVVEIYRVFPKDSTNPPSGAVPTRVNSPSDVAFTSVDSTSGLSFSTSVVSASFTAANSVINGISPIPNQTTGGEGPVTGEEVTFNINFTTPLDLPADHYFFVPQVETSSGQFLWLSAPKPIGAGGTPFAPDLQEWIRNDPLDPNWLRVGTDIVGPGANTAAPTFNASFSLAGSAVPLPPAVWSALATLTLIGAAGAIKRRTA